MRGWFVRAVVFLLFASTSARSSCGGTSSFLHVAGRCQRRPSLGRRRPHCSARQMTGGVGGPSSWPEGTANAINQTPVLEDLSRKKRKKRKGRQDYERRRTMWLERYGSASALRSTFGAGPPLGDLGPHRTRALYHTLLPRSLLGLSVMGLMKPEELAPLAYEARVAAKEYARSRCIWTGRLATWAFDQYRSLRDRKRFLGPRSSSSMSWEEVLSKYEGQIVKEECEEAIDGSRKQRKRKKKLDEETLTMRIYMRILEKSCATNQAFDSLFLTRDDGSMDSDLLAIASQLEHDVRAILLSPKDSSKVSKQAEKALKKKEKVSEKEEKRQRRAERKEDQAGKKILEKQQKIETKKETQGRKRRRDDKEAHERYDEEDIHAVVEESDTTATAATYSQQWEALRVLAGTRRQFRTLFPTEKSKHS